MPLDPVTSSPPVTLRPHGLVRVLPAAFLAFWLCGWAMGEAFAIAGVAGCLHALFGMPVPELLSKVRTPAGSAVPVLAFLLVWLTFWTIGGLAAMVALASLLWGEDEVAWDRETVEVRHRAFPFFHTTRVAFADVWRFELARSGGGLVGLGRRGRRTITGNGTAADRLALLDRLREAHAAARRSAPRADGSPLAAPGATGLPPGWSEHPDETGQLALVESARPMRVAGGLLALVAAVLLASGARLATEALARDADAGRTIGATAMVVIALLVGWGAAALATTRRALRASAGSIEERVTRLGRTRERTWSPAALALERTTDSDHDEFWELLVRSGGAKPATLIRAMDDPGPALQLGRWLSARAGVPFADAVPDSTRPAA